MGEGGRKGRRVQSPAPWPPGGVHQHREGEEEGHGSRAAGPPGRAVRAAAREGEEEGAPAWTRHGHEGSSRRRSSTRAPRHAAQICGRATLLRRELDAAMRARGPALRRRDRGGERGEWVGWEIRLGGSHSPVTVEGVGRVDLSRKCR